MSLEKIAGLEQEYAIQVEQARYFDPVEMSYLVVDSFNREHQIIWDYVKETPLADARGFSERGDEIQISQKENYKVNNLLGNGARLYVDHAHPEFSTAECRNVYDLIAFDKAGELIMNMASEGASQRLPAGQEIRIYKNNTDHKGNTYGTHENYLVQTSMYDRLFPALNQPPELILKHLVPFLVTRQIFCGAGKVGSENRTGPVDYQISQRADFFESVVGGQTTFCRPIVNSRDEPHADRRYFRRLHVIAGDANLTEFSTFLKIGTMQLILRMLEDGFLKESLELDQPVQAMVNVSHDITCRKPVKLLDGRQFSPVEIQRRFMEAAEDYCASGMVEPDDSMLCVLKEWRSVLDDLAEDPDRLYRKIDWVVKKWLIERLRAKKNLPWRDPRVKRIDIQYHDINREKGLYYILEREGQVERIFEDDKLIHYFLKHPPSDTRAFFRSRCITQYTDQVLMANWDVITFKTGRSVHKVIPLQDPRKGTEAHVGDLLDNSPDIRTLFENLEDRQHASAMERVKG